MDRLLDLPARDLDAVRALAVEHRKHDHTAAPVDNLLERHVLEAARFSPFPPGLVRYCADGFKLETGKGKQVTVPPKATLLALTIAVAFDPKFAPYPSSFLAGRPANQYLLFGTGQHQCVAGTTQRPIALSLMTEMAAAVFSLPNVRRAPGRAGTLRQVKRWPTSFQLVRD
jgi:cytochrome P450